MRVLVVAPQPPLLDGGAAGRCTVALLRGISSHGLAVSCLAATDDPANGVAPPRDLALDLVPARPPPGRGWRGIPGRLTHPVDGLAHTPLADALADRAATSDLVHLDQIETAALGPVPTRPTVLHLHYRALRDASAFTLWRSQTRFRIELARAEALAIRKFAWLVVHSAQMADSVRKENPRSNPTVIRLPLDVADYPIAPAVESPTAGLLGTATWGPTAAATKLLLQRVWPEVHRRHPSARLRIAGRGMDRFVVPDPSVEAVGEVPSAAGFLSTIGVLVYPVPRGSGAKVKVLEALACRVPVVTLAAGAEGVSPNEGVVVSRTIDEVAKVTARLLQDPQERAERGRAGRRYLESHHAPGPATEPLVALYQRILERG